jgi:hypothetical protein
MKITHLELNRIGHSQTTTRTFREKDHIYTNVVFVLLPSMEF